jgi:hypothetical protein
MVADGRCLFVLNSARVGTGPLGIRLDDVIFVLGGVPAPMVLRPEQGSSSYRVVGPASVHGIMFGEDFAEYHMVDITLV